jgi:uncharacterized membrane-anchored protein YitT (DUF2179 family)
MKKYVEKNFRWSYQEFGLALLGELLFAFAINLFIVPNALYNGGVLGIAQLIRTAILDLTGLSMKIDFSGIISLLINIPLFIMAYKYVSKYFFNRSLLCTIASAIFLTIVPIPGSPLVDSVLTNVLIGSILAGYGCGMALSTGASGGGTEIIGIVASLKNKRFTVGKISLYVNLAVYAICGYLYGIQVMIYSVIYSVISSFIVDNTHKQNICCTATIFTKERPDKIVEYVKNELDRDVTTWEAIGLHKETKTYVSYVVLSKYELIRLEKAMPRLDKHAFLTKSDYVSIYGNFEKKVN